MSTSVMQSLSLKRENGSLGNVDILITERQDFPYVPEPNQLRFRLVNLTHVWTRDICSCRQSAKLRSSSGENYMKPTFMQPNTQSFWLSQSSGRSLTLTTEICALCHTRATSVFDTLSSNFAPSHFLRVFNETRWLYWISCFLVYSNWPCFLELIHLKKSKVQ